MDPIKDLYSAIKSSGLFVDESDFRNQISKSPKDVYGALASTKLFVDYNDFENQLGFKKKDGGVTPPSGPSSAALKQLEDLRKQLKENQLKPQRTEAPKETKQAQLRAETIKTKEEVTPKVTQMMVYKKPTFKVEYPEQEELTARILGFKNAQQRIEFQQEDERKKQEKIQQSADEFYKTSLGKFYFNFYQPLAESGARAIGNTGATISRLAGENQLADAIVERFDPQKRYKGTIAGNKPTKLQGSLFNDGKVNYSKMPSTVVRGLTDMAWLINPSTGISKAGQVAGLTEKAALGTGLIVNSFLQSREDYYQEGKASGLKGDALDNFATGAAGLTATLEAVFPNTIAMGGFKSKMAKEYALQIANGITTKAALKAGAKEVLKEAFVKENTQELTQLAGDKVARLLTDMATGEDNFGDQFDWEKSKDEIYETLVITPIVSLFAAGSGAIKNYTPTNYEKALFYDASKNAKQVNQFLDNKFIQNEITEDQYKQAKQKFASYNTALEQVKNLGYSEDQTLQMAWELFSGKEKMPTNQAVVSDPILKDALGTEIKKDKETISENIKSIGMGIPSVGSDIEGKELSFVISNIGDKGAEIGQGLVDQIGDDTYRVEEVSIKDIYDNNPEFRSYVESYKKGSIDADAMLVPAILKDNNIVDGRARLAEQYLAGKDRVKIFKNISNAINQSEVEVAGTESDIIQPQGIVQGQPEVGQGTGQQGQATQPQANVSDSNIGGQGTIVTLAPFYNTTVSNTADAKKVRETPEYKQYFNSIPTVAKALGLDVEIVNETIGGFINSAGEKITEVSNKIFVANGTIDQAEEFGAIMGTMTPETQEATIAARYVSEQEKDSVPADEYVEEIGIRVGDIDGALESLKEAGIFDFTVDEDKNTVSILDFSRGQDVEFDNNIANFVSILEGKNISYEKEGRRPVNSRYIGPSKRTEILERIAGDAARLQQGGEDLRSIIAEARRRDQRFGEEEVARQARKAQMETELKEDLGLNAVEYARKSLQSTGVSVDVITDPNEFDNLVEQLGGQRGTEGAFISDQGRIILNESKLQEGINAGRIVWHESSHPVINIIRNTQPELYNRVISGMKSSDNPAVQQAIAWANQNYQGEGVIDDESIVEAIAMVADGTLDLNQVSTGLKQSIIDFINLIARAFRLGKVRDTDVQEFKNIVGKIADALTSGRDIAQVVGQENVFDYGLNLGSPVQLRVGDVKGEKASFKPSYQMSFVKPSDKINIIDLVKDIESKEEKVWFWVADQLGRGMYYDKVVQGEHYLDAGPSFALDPKNRDNKIIWATGKGEKWVNDKIANSDYIFIISGSPTKSKLFNKRVSELTFNRIKKSLGEDGAWDKFKSEILAVSKIGAINTIMDKYNSFEELLDSPDRKELLIQIDAQKEKKGTPLKALLERYKAFVDYNDLRDGFYKDNDFKLNDIMLVLKPTGYGGKSAHSTYENDILGEVVGVPDRKINAFDIMPDEFKAKYSPEMSRTEQSQAVAPYGAGIRNVQASVGNRDIINGFYSPIEDRINTFKQPKASVQKWKEIVGVKSDEAVFSGLADWLGGMKPDRQISKEEVLQFMKDNRVEINEVVKGSKDMGTWVQDGSDYSNNVTGQRIVETDIVDDNGDNLYQLLDEDGFDILGEAVTLDRAMGIQNSEASGTKFFEYQLPGGENYKEVLITMPRNEDKAIAEYNKVRDELDEFLTNLDIPTEADGLRYAELSKKAKELQDKLPKNTLIQQGRAYQGTLPFRSSHFDEPNIITHLRMNTRTDADDKKVLFLEEVQSDWGQKGKKEGFKTDVDKWVKTLRLETDGNQYRLYEGDVLWGKGSSEAEAVKVAKERKSSKDIGIPTAPYVTNTNAWVKLGLKVALKEAVRQGADRIAWTTGDQQNERYDLSKVIDSIEAVPAGTTSDGKITAFRLESKYKSGEETSGYYRSEELEDVVGKDLSQKIISDGGGTYRGVDLAVGGKGMKAFYGDAKTPGIVGNVAKALVKELTGKEGSVVESVINTGGNLPNTMTVAEIQAAGGVDAVKTGNANSVQPAIDITPELKASVQGGIPQFSVGNRPENNTNFKLAAFVMRKKAEGATDGEIAIAIASVTGMKPEGIKTLIDNPEQYIRDMFPSMSELQQDNLIQKAKLQNIYRGRQFGKPIDKAFTGLEVPKEKIDEYMRKTAGADNFVKEWAKDFKKNWLDPAKGLPSWVLAIKDFASGTKNIEISRAAKTIERLKAEAKKIGFQDWNAFSKALVVAKDVKRFIPNEDGIVPFDAGVAAAGRMFTTPDDQLPALVPEEIKALPQEIIPYVYAMRGQIDNLTRDLIGNGYVTPEQAVTLENNIGQYVNRSYRMYNEMRYKPEKETYNAAVKFLADQYIKQIATDKAGVITYEEVQNEAIEKAKKDVEAILNKKKNPYFNASTDRRNTGILEQRKDIPEPIRKLMGEYTDPGTVFMMTVAKQAALKASSEYLGKLRENGMGTLFFEQDDPSRPASHSVQIASTGTESMSPLGGLFTTPEIAEALETVEPTYNELTNSWMKLVGAVRWGKTVGSIATQLKNFESNLGFAVLNGMLLSGKNTKAFGAAAKYVKGQYSEKEIDAITEKVIKLNLVGQSVGMRELKTMLGSGDMNDIAVDIALSPDGKWGKKVAKKLNVFGAANKLYRLGDDFWKVYAYINEREQLSDARFGQAYDQLTPEQQDQIDVESSERVKSTWPTYDRVVEAAKFVSKRAPIFGNFISFQAESLRVLANSIKIAKEDLKDPKTAHLGVRRIAGITAYFGLRSAITIGLAKLTGFAAAGILGAAFGDDEEERNKKAMQEALPTFMRTGELFVKRTKDPHRFVVVNGSSLDPYAIIPNSLNAFTEGREGIFKKTMDPGVGAATAELFSSFLEPEMTFQTMWSVMNNIDPKTKQDIVLSTDSDAQAFAKVAGKVWDQLEPSSVAMVQRLVERKDKEAELLAIIGARPYDVDLHKSFGYILSQFGRDVDAINREYNGIRFKEVPQEDKDAAEKAAEDKKAFAISRVNEIYRNFINLGADPKVLDDLINQRSSIKVTGFDKNTKKYLKTGDIKREKLFK
jgi:hypothetical protein